MDRLKKIKWKKKAYWNVNIKKKRLIKFLVPINIHSFVFGPYKIKSHFLVPVTFSLSILGTKTVDGNFWPGLKVLMENFIGTKKCDFIL